MIGKRERELMMHHCLMLKYPDVKHLKEVSVTLVQ